MGGWLAPVRFWWWWLWRPSWWLSFLIVSAMALPLLSQLPRERPPRLANQNQNSVGTSPPSTKPPYVECRFSTIRRAKIARKKKKTKTKKSVFESVFSILGSNVGQFWVQNRFLCVKLCILTAGNVSRSIFGSKNVVQ